MASGKATTSPFRDSAARMTPPTAAMRARTCARSMPLARKAFSACWSSSPSSTTAPSQRWQYRTTAWSVARARAEAELTWDTSGRLGEGGGGDQAGDGEGQVNEELSGSFRERLAA